MSKKKPKRPEAKVKVYKTEAAMTKGLDAVSRRMDELEKLERPDQAAVKAGDKVLVQGGEDFFFWAEVLPLSDEEAAGVRRTSRQGRLYSPFTSPDGDVEMFSTFSVACVVPSDRFEIARKAGWPSTRAEIEAAFIQAAFPGFVGFGGKNL